MKSHVFLKSLVSCRSGFFFTTKITYVKVLTSLLNMSYSREPYLIAEQQTLRNFDEDWGIVFNQISGEIGMPGSEGFPRKNFNYSRVVAILKELICQYKQFKNIGDIPLIERY